MIMTSIYANELLILIQPEVIKSLGQLEISPSRDYVEAGKRQRLIQLQGL